MYNKKIILKNPISGKEVLLSDMFNYTIGDNVIYEIDPKLFGLDVNGNWEHGELTKDQLLSRPFCEKKTWEQIQELIDSIDKRLRLGVDKINSANDLFVELIKEFKQ